MWLVVNFRDICAAVSYAEVLRPCGPVERAINWGMPRPAGFSTQPSRWEAIASSIQVFRRASPLRCFGASLPGGFLDAADRGPMRGPDPPTGFIELPPWKLAQSGSGEALNGAVTQVPASQRFWWLACPSNKLEVEHDVGVRRDSFFSLSYARH